MPKASEQNCDGCKHYHWYYDYCDKWHCEVDAREVHNCIEQMETPILNAMVTGGMSHAESK